MPATNTSFLTATQLPDFPCDTTQTDINSAGVNATVYYRFTTGINSKVIGAWGFSGNIASGYRPNIFVYKGPAAAPVPVLSIGAQNKPIQFPVETETEYFLEFVKNLDDAVVNTLRVRCEDCPAGNPATSDIMVIDSTLGFPMWVGTPGTDNETRTLVKDMPTGQAGDIVPSGIMCLENGATASIKLYNTTGFTPIFDSGFLGGGTNRIKSNSDRNLFYIGRFSGGSSVYYTLTLDGVLSAATPMPTLADIGALCANPGDQIIYISPDGVTAPIRKWDIVAHAFLPNLVAGIANYEIPDIIMLSGQIFALYHNTVTQDVNVKQYNISGAVVMTYSLGIQGGTAKPRMTWATDTPDSFWVMTHNSSGQSVFTNLRVTDAAVLMTRLQAEYNNGVYAGAETATPNARFGNSSSGLFLIMALSTPPGIFVITLNKRYDSDGRLNVAIPTPTFKTALLP